MSEMTTFIITVDAKPSPLTGEFDAETKEQAITDAKDFYSEVLGEFPEDIIILTVL